MSTKKAILSNTKKTSLTEELPANQSHSSLDKIDKKQMSLSTHWFIQEFSNSLVKSNKNNGLLLKELHSEKREEKKNFLSS